MIYVCASAHNDATTVGLVLWKIRQVFSAFPREYHFLIADDGSTDSTAEVLESYQRVLPLTVIQQKPARGYAATIETLLRDALARSDRPKRDFAITTHPNFEVSPEALPLLVRAMESGADLVVAEDETVDSSFARRFVRRNASWLLRPGLRVPGVQDLLSGVCAVRLSTLRYCLGESKAAFLQTEGRAARAELVARTAAVARQISVISSPPSNGPIPAVPEGTAFSLALELFRAGRRLRVPAPTAEVRRPADRSAEKPAEKPVEETHEHEVEEVS
ncbi:MAG: glycosyltransferase [Gemmatimonadetes bacterium]|nr:glycosyltransferase [Gemmatimonadota bacterium]